MGNSREINATEYRELIAAIGGPFKPGDKLRCLFWLVAERAGLAPRMVRKAWSGETVSPQTLQRLQEARAKHEALNAAAQLETVVASLERAGAALHRQEIAALRAAIGALRGADSSGPAGG